MVWYGVINKRIVENVFEFLYKNSTIFYLITATRSSTTEETSNSEKKTPTAIQKEQQLATLN